MNQSLIQIVKEKFNALFGNEAHLLVKSPGRINVLGGHTDYNDGFVLPAAINKAIYIAISPISDSAESTVHAIDLDDTIVFAKDDIQRQEKAWANYILGVIHQMRERGHMVGNFQAVFAGDIPQGGGLSSSAALECGFGFAFNELYRFGLDRPTIAFIGLKAEHTYAGVMCGIMDQFASSLGKENHLIKLDCRSLNFEYFPIEMEGYEFLLLNTKVSHNLASSEYNTRRAQCEKAVEVLNEKFGGITALRDGNMNQLEAVKESLDAKVYDRAKYIIEENERVIKLTKALSSKDLNLVGTILYQTHEGLTSEFEVSCDELDFLIDESKKHAGVLGGRMMGGGFGGCTLNLVKKSEVKKFLPPMQAAYEEKFGRPFEVYEVYPSNGTEIIQ